MIMKREMAQPKENGKQLNQRAARAIRELEDVFTLMKKLACPYKMLQSLTSVKTCYNYQKVRTVPFSFAVLQVLGLHGTSSETLGTERLEGSKA